jgi:F-type H+-transporting ATPase subunit b
MPQLDMSTWPPQLFWLAVTFLALYFVISRVAIPRTGGVIALRKSTIDGDLAKAKNLKDETENAVRSYEAFQGRQGQGSCHCLETGIG